MEGGWNGPRIYMLHHKTRSEASEVGTGRWDSTEGSLERSMLEEVNPRGSMGVHIHSSQPILLIRSLLDLFMGTGMATGMGMDMDMEMDLGLSAEHNASTYTYCMPANRKYNKAHPIIAILLRVFLPRP
ncbi:hypothetical protein Z517_00766 [Fonsecaea pedrosoi CBS 271.37]|uniref:Uncharacterized protein n=1 Tax=Fonsecaea pedrosoi CBS 271.37 TaxID=1442368 RepID=A0A0D2E5L3_9EURO|nr:uncharacterized protein Z517_00766 [Fonsecaea pedrosoi CBS 271.37]KIW85376.1 hypothetical protein Z517_00766 [Fonsecaea pedrosoi CBS 271.37]